MKKLLISLCGMDAMEAGDHFKNGAISKSHKSREYYSKKKMNKKMLIVAVTGIIWMIFFACGRQYQGKLVPKLDNSAGKWGFADTLGKMVIAPQWDITNDFSEGLAVVGLNNRYGYVDRTGIEKIPLQYDNALPFYEGLAEVELDGKIGSIDTTGVIIIPFRYKELQYLVGSWGLSEAKLNTRPDDPLGLDNVGFTVEDINYYTLSFEKIDSFKSNIDFSNLFEGDFKESKSLQMEKNDCWQFENFETGQQVKDTFIFSCDLILSPLSKEITYKLTLISADELRLEFYEEFNVASREDLYGTTKGGDIHLQNKFVFKRL